MERISARHSQTVRKFTRLLRHGVGPEDINKGWRGGLENRWVRVKPQVKLYNLRDLPKIDPSPRVSGADQRVVT